MPKRSELTISKRTVDGLSVDGKEAVFWDRDLPRLRGPGLPLRQQDLCGAKPRTVRHQAPLAWPPRRDHRRGGAQEGRRRHRPHQAGRGPGCEAVRACVHRRRSGRALHGGPRQDALQRAHAAGSNAGSLRNHILPALGAMEVVGVGRAEVAALHHGMREKPRAANRALMVLSKMYSLAEAWGVAPPGGNPCRFVVRYKEGRRERFLSEDEYRSLGLALCELEAEGPGRGTGCGGAAADHADGVPSRGGADAEGGATSTARPGRFVFATRRRVRGWCR